jgi:hypothetical protein
MAQDGHQPLLKKTRWCVLQAPADHILYGEPAKCRRRSENQCARSRSNDKGERINARYVHG